MSSSQRFEMHASAAEVATGNSAWFSVPTLSMLAMGVDLTAISGAGATLSVWLQGSDDGGTTAYDIASDQRFESSTAATDITAALDKRNIVDAETAVAKWMAIYKELPTDTVRLAWVISGTTPSITFSASAVGK